MAAQIPEQFEPRFLDDMDGRTNATRRLRQRLTQLHADLGGPERLSYAQKSLCLRAIWLESWLEAREVDAAEGRPIDIGKQTQALNSLLGLWRTLGIERKATDVKDLGAYLRERQEAPA